MTRFLLGVALVVLCWTPMATAASVTLDTGTAAWTVSGGGATNATPFTVAGILISVTSNSLNSGTFVSGGSAAGFDGFWTAQLQFFLPSNATGVALNFANLQADDRSVLELNGGIIGSAGIFGPGPGQMTFTDGGSNVAFTFGGNPSSGSASSGFILGGTNTLLAIVNDTGTGISGTLNNSGSFETVFGMTGTVTYTAGESAVPEPSTAWLFLLGSGVLLLASGRQKFGSPASKS